ncbi:ankyrin repeat domain-containing protein [Flavobacterium sp. Fl-318]|uniref:Ankyrin repeat domain-containing protein n=1 Tax=Flavobacterium cupriresistens TaxID=2893885 RepID=A0ABU4RCW1_9FLAO|nr:MULTISPECIES: ankyrin repeat domain-containing protein [unclassified Flavobacterium]MDX6189504.1 ankyrin repeat domain-containing protein [Flavobacterium sp. Fl-318]UFH41087.1 ankyrin repeat domain-containing protein [Flavobacterium sp. F-323]
MKKILFTAIIAATLQVNAQENKLLDANFWKASPNLATLKAEIEKGNNPAELNANAFDPVVLAINNSAPLEDIKYLLELPGNATNKMTHDNRIYLHWAAYKGNTELVQHLIAKGSDINLEDSHGTTPIAFAASAGVNNPTTYDAFFKAGIDPKKKYSEGATLLLLAIPGDKDLTITDYLVSKGLSLKEVDSHGNTAFDYAARSGNVDLLKKLAAKGVKYTDNALITAAQGMRRSANSIEVFKYLVDDLKLKPTATASNGQTVLHIIAYKEKQAEIVKYFIDKGVDANKADKEGNTALIIAAAGKDVELIQTLLPKVKNINAVNTKGESALTAAVKGSSTEVISLLLSKGADINVKDTAGNNLAFYLIESYKGSRGGAQKDDFDDKLNLLKSKGINFAAQQKDGSTLYYTAAAKNNIALLKKLDGLNIDVNAKNKEGLTALHKAAMIAKDDSVLKYLLSIGAKKEIKTEFDETAYNLAQENELLTKNNIAIDFLK